MSEKTIPLPFALVEGLHLIGLLDEFVQLVTNADHAQDAALDRLSPDLYPDDHDASEEFREQIHGDLLDRRAADAAQVRHDLEGFEDADLSDPLVLRDVAIPVDHIDSWLRTLSAMRLIIATRLGIETNDDHDPADPRFAVYDWLGYRLDGLVQTADDNDV